MKEDVLIKTFLQKVIETPSHYYDIGVVIATSDYDTMREFLSLSPDQQAVWIENQSEAAQQILETGEYKYESIPLLTIWSWDEMPEKYEHLFHDVDAEFLVRFYSIDEIDGDELYSKYRVVKQDEFDNFVLLAVDKKD